MLTVLGALDVFAPLVADDLDLEADLGPVALQHLGHQFGVGVVRPLHRHRPQGDLGTFLHAGGLEQFLGFFRVVGGVLDAVVVGPLRRRHGVDRQLPRALVDGIQNALLVHRHVQRLAHFELVERLVAHVVGDVAEVEAWLGQQLQVRVRLEGVHVSRARMQGHLAFAGLEFLHPHRSVGVDGENQLVELDPARVPVLFVAHKTNLRVFLITLEHEGASANRLLVDVARPTGLEQLLGVFGRQDRSEAHRNVLHERGVDRVQGHHHGVRAGFFDLGNVLVQAHPVEVRKLGGVGLAKWMVGVKHAVEGEQHVVGVEVARRLEFLVAVELHPFTQVEGVGQAIRGNIPLGCQPRDDVGRAFFELHQTVIQRLRRIVVGGGGVLRSVKPCRAAFGAEHQALFLGGLAHGGHGQQAGGKQSGYNGGMAHDDPGPCL